MVKHEIILTHCCRDKVVAIIQTTFQNSFSSMIQWKSVSGVFRFRWNLLLGVQLANKASLVQAIKNGYWKDISGGGGTCTFATGNWLMEFSSLALSLYLSLLLLLLSLSLSLYYHYYYIIIIIIIIFIIIIIIIIIITIIDISIISSSSNSIFSCVHYHQLLPLQGRVHKNAIAYILEVQNEMK